MTRDDERRRALRTPIDFFVQVRREGRIDPRRPADRIDQMPSEGHVDLQPATDISTTGIYLLASDDHGALDPGGLLDLEFTLPTGVVVRTLATIAYLDDRLGQRGLGLEFHELPASDRDDIERFVAASVAAQGRLG